MDYFGYIKARVMCFFYGLTKKVESGEVITGELYYVPQYEGDPNKGKSLRIIRHVFVTTDPAIGKRPCFEVELPNGKKRFYSDPRVSSYEDKKGRRNRILTKVEAGL